MIHKRVIENFGQKRDGRDRADEKQKNGQGQLFRKAELLIQSDNFQFGRRRAKLFFVTNERPNKQSQLDQDKTEL